MSTKVLGTVAAMTIALAGPLVAAPLALADDGPCDVTSSITVCDSNGSASLIATPPVVDGGPDNGPYGPAGNTPPVGGRGLG